MSRVRALVGTRKGAFILESDGTRKRWDVHGPHFGGWEMVSGSVRDGSRCQTRANSHGCGVPSYQRWGSGTPS